MLAVERPAQCYLVRGATIGGSVEVAFLGDLDLGELDPRHIRPRGQRGLGDEPFIRGQVMQINRQLSVGTQFEGTPFVTGRLPISIDQLIGDLVQRVIRQTGALGDGIHFSSRFIDR